jgi:hypothetical protein
VLILFHDLDYSEANILAVDIADIGWDSSLALVLPGKAFARQENRAMIFG